MKINHQIIRTEKQLRQYLSTCSDDLAFDTETTGLQMTCLLLGISMYDGEQDPVFVGTDYFFENCMDLATIVRIFKEYSHKIKRINGIAHNGKFDQTIFRLNQLPKIPLRYDTMLMAHNYDSAIEKKLETRAEVDLGVKKKDFKELIGKKWEKINWQKEGNVLFPTLAKYACEDVYCTHGLRDFYLPKLEKEDLLKVHDKIELPLVDVLAKMWERGVLIDKPFLEQMGKDITKDLKVVTEKIYNEAGAVFNLNSPQQKANILFDKLRLPNIKATKSGARSTDSDTLEILAMQGHKIAQYMVEYSEMQKLNSGYIQAIPRMLNEDGRLRCNLNSAGTKTGRFSCNEPNLQNQPNNKKYPVRAAFIPAVGHGMQAYDYSQIELRVMAHVSKDKRFMDAFWAGEDIHGVVARDLGIDRKHAKIINFGILYGMGATKLGYNLGLSFKEAKGIISNYENTYSGYYRWKVHTEKMASQNGYVKTICGRIRRLPATASRDSAQYFGALRQAVNTAIQGSAADIIKLAMVQIAKRVSEEKLNSYMLLQVHDELVFETEFKHIAQAHDLIKETMEKTTILSVPLEVDGKVVENWAQMKDDNFQSLLPKYQNGDYSLPNINTYPAWVLH